ncbi:MAG: hypothetical protein Q9160_007310 [Pyrenula sp. 1 TL-2023]
METANELLRVLQRLRIESKRDLVRKLLRSLVKRKYIKDVQKKLQSYQELLDTAILVKLDARSIKESDDFESLSQDIKSLARALNNGQSSFKQLIQYDGVLTRNHIDHEMRSTRDLIVREVNKRSLQVEQEKLLQSLFYPEMAVRQENINDPYEGTCEWLFQFEEDDDTTEPWSRDNDLRVENRVASEMFLTWLQEDKDMFWIMGKAGAGKSTLMKHLFHHRRTHDELSNWSGSRDIPTILAGFFFWNPGTSLQKSLLGMLRSILHQIISQRPSLTSLLSSGPRRSANDSKINFTFTGAQEWTVAGLFEVFRCLLASLAPQNHICVFLDGLDELESRTQDLLAFIKLLREAPRVKICVSSRPEQAFRSAFKDVFQVRMQDLNRYDIARAAKGRLRLPLMKSCPANHKETERLIRDISRKAEGVFLWAEIVVEDVRKGIENEDTLEMLQKRLDILPSSIEDLYRHMLTGVSDLYWNEAAAYLSLLLLPRFTGRLNTSPLTLLDLAFMHDDDKVSNHVSVQRPHFSESEAFAKICTRHETRIYACCAGLIEVSKKPQRFINGLKIAERELGQDVSIMWESFGLGSSDESPACHFREISFIHRTIEEFLGAHLQEFFKDPSWNIKAAKLLLKCKLGSMNLLHILFDYENTKNRCREYTFGSATHFSIPDVRILNIGPMVFEAMNLVSILDGRSDSSVLHWVSRICETVAGVKRSFGGDEAFRFETCVDRSRLSEPQYPVPFRDATGLSAFFGLFQTVHDWIHAEQRCVEQLTYLIECAAMGGATFLNLSDNQLKTLQNLVSLWLQHGGDLNAPVHFLEHSWDKLPHLFSKSLTWVLRRPESIWAGFFQNTLRAIISDERTWNSAWQPWLETLQVFLDLGADPNARIFHYHKFPEQRYRFDIFTEETPFSCLESRMGRRGLSCIPYYEGRASWFHSVGEILLSRQGYRYRRCHFLRVSVMADPHPQSEVKAESGRARYHTPDTEGASTIKGKNERRIVNNIIEAFENESGVYHIDLDGKYSAHLFVITKEQSDRFFSRWEQWDFEDPGRQIRYNAMKELLYSLDDDAEVTEEKFYQMWEKRHEAHENKSPMESLDVDFGTEDKPII